MYSQEKDFSGINVFKPIHMHCLLEVTGVREGLWAIIERNRRDWT